MWCPNCKNVGLALPFHSHVGLNYVISDYVPKAHRAAARGGLLFATAITVAGIFKMNYDGPGLTETLKSLWRKPADKKWIGRVKVQIRRVSKLPQIVGWQAISRFVDF